MSIKILTDSACDMTQEEAKKIHVEVLPLKILFGTEEYLDGISLSHEQFFEKLIETDELPHTSQLSPFEYENAFRKITETGDTAICITLSSELSGCYQSACIGAEEFGDSVKIVDSQNACIGQRILTELAAMLRDEGKSADEIVARLNEEKKNIRVIALLDTLEYLKKGGRISAAAAMAGSLLSIKPVVSIKEGKVALLGKARGSKNGNNLLTEFIQKEGKIDFQKPLCLAYSGLSDKLLQKYMNDHTFLYQDYKAQLPISLIGSAIGTHIGPGAIAIAFFKK